MLYGDHRLRGELTRKTYQLRTGRIGRHLENATSAEILVAEGDEFEVWGVTTTIWAFRP